MKLIWKRAEKKKTIGTGKIPSSEMQFTTRMKKLDFALIREGQLQTIIICG